MSINFTQLLDEIVATESVRQQFRQHFPLLNFNDIKDTSKAELDAITGIVYLDSGATSLRPQAVIDDFTHKASIHASIDRSSGKLASLTQELYDQAKTELVHYFEPSFSKDQLVFTNNSTDSLNIIAEVLADFYNKQYQAWQEQYSNQQVNSLLNSSDIYYVLVSASNHHANLLPWEKLTKVPNIKLVMIPILENGQLDLNFFQRFLKDHGKTCLLTSVSTVVNVNGIVNDIKTIKTYLNQYAPNCLLCLDHAQGSTFNHKYQQLVFGKSENSIESINNVHSDYELDPKLGLWQADFLIGSLHKMYGFTGLGYLIVGSRIYDYIQQASKLSNTNLKLLELFKLKTAHNTKDVTTSNNSQATNLDSTISSSNNTKTNITNNNTNVTSTNLVYDNFYQANSNNQNPNNQNTNNQNPNTNSSNKQITLAMSRVGGGHVNDVRWQDATSQFDITYKPNTNPFDLAGTSNLNAILTIPALFNWYKNFNWPDLDQSTKLIRTYIIEKLKTFPGVKDLTNHPHPAQVIFVDEQALDDEQDATVLPLITYILPSDGHHILLSFSDGQDDEIVHNLTQAGFVVRVGKHCCHPLHKSLQLESTVRITLSPFNNFRDAYLLCSNLLQQINNSLIQAVPDRSDLVLDPKQAFAIEQTDPYVQYLKPIS